MSAARGAGGGTMAIGYDVATSLWQGKRPYQEDTLLADFHGGMDRGFAVLADGMGGHAAGDLASRLVVIDAVSHLKFLMHDGAALEKNLQSELKSAIETANGVLKDRAADDRRLQGMGATFLATVLFEDRLYWASVGDSPLYLWREGKLRQLNEDHSMAPIIDQMAKSGELSEEEAANHPDRNALTSVLMGRSVKSMDVPGTAMVLDPGDVLIQASDGLQYLDEAEIVKVLEGVTAKASSRQIADALMHALHDLDDPSQDNTAILVLQLTEDMGGGGGMAAGTATAKADGERAVVGAATAAAVASTGGAATARAADAVDPVPDPDPPEKRRKLLVPAALLGGAALALGLIFGLPSEQDTTDPGTGAQQAGAEDVRVSDDPDPADPDAGTADAAVAVVEPDTPISDDPAPEAVPAETAEPVIENAGVETPEDTDLPVAEAADEGAPGEEAGGTDEEPDPAPAEGDIAAPADGDIPETPQVAGADADASVPNEGDAPAEETTPAEDLVAAGEPTDGPTNDGAAAGESEEPLDAPETDPDAPEIATAPEPVRGSAAPNTVSSPEGAPDRGLETEAQTGVANAEDAPQPVVAGPATETGETAGAAETGDATEPGVGDGQTGTGAAAGFGAAPQVPAGGAASGQGSVPSGEGAGIVADTSPTQTPTPAPAPAPAAAPAPTPLPAPTPVPAPAPAPSPTPTPVPTPAPVTTPAPTATPLPTVTPAPDAGVVQPSVVPGVGPLREGLSAPSGGEDSESGPTPAPVPAPQPDPQAVPQAPLIITPATPSETGEDDRATQMAPSAPSGPQPVAPSANPSDRAGNGATITPMLPPFTGSIQRICQAQQCFAIIRQPDGTVTILQRRRQ